MKNLFVCFLLFTSVSSYGQFATTENVDAIDLKLDKFRIQQNTGSVVQIIGGLVGLLGFFTQQNNGNEWELMYVVSGGCILAGTITKMTSYSILKPTKTPAKIE